jgi:hypothetical protein
MTDIRSPARTLLTTSCELGAATGVPLRHLPCGTVCYVSTTVADDHVAARAFWIDPCTKALTSVCELTHAQLRSLITLAMLTPEHLPPLFPKEL